MGNYALIKDGIVLNVAVWDGETDVDFGDGITTVELEEYQPVSPGYIYKDGVFTAPPLTEEELAAQESAKKASNAANKDALMSQASQRISVLQDAVELEMATEEEEAALPLWKKYRVLLSRIDANTADDISWPKMPAYI